MEKTYIVKFSFFGISKKIGFTVPSDAVVNKETVLKYIQNRIKIDSISEEIYTDEEIKEEREAQNEINKASKLFNEFFGNTFKY